MMDIDTRTQVKYFEVLIDNEYIDWFDIGFIYNNLERENFLVYTDNDDILDWLNNSESYEDYFKRTH